MVFRTCFLYLLISRPPNRRFQVPHHVSAQSGSLYVLATLLFFRTLCEKTAEPVMLKCKVYAQCVQKNTSHFQSCNPIKFQGRIIIFNLFYGSSPWWPFCRNGATFQNSKINLSRRDSQATFTSSLVKVPSCLTTYTQCLCLKNIKLGIIINTCTSNTYCYIY